MGIENGRAEIVRDEKGHPTYIFFEGDWSLGALYRNFRVKLEMYMERGYWPQ